MNHYINKINTLKTKTLLLLLRKKLYIGRIMQLKSHACPHCHKEIKYIDFLKGFRVNTSHNRVACVYCKEILLSDKNLSKMLSSTIIFGILMFFIFFFLQKQSIMNDFFNAIVASLFFIGGLFLVSIVGYKKINNEKTNP